MEPYRDHGIGNELGGQGTQLLASLLLDKSFTRQKKCSGSPATGWARLPLQAGCWRALCGDKLQRCNVGKPVCVRDLIFQYDHMSLRCKEGNYQFRSIPWGHGRLCGRVGKWLKRTIVVISTRKDWEWPRIIHTVSATYPILCRPQLITQIGDFRGKTVFVKEADICQEFSALAKSNGGRERHGQRSLWRSEVVKGSWSGELKGTDRWPKETEHECRWRWLVRNQNKQRNLLSSKDGEKK